MSNEGLHEEAKRAGLEWLEQQRKGGNNIPDMRELDAARSGTAGRPGDDGTVTFGKKGPREWDAGGVAKAHETSAEAEIARAAAVLDAMTEFRARFYVAFLNPAPKRWEDLDGRAARTKEIAEVIIASERNWRAFVPGRISPVEVIAYRSAVAREAGNMLSLGLLRQIVPPDPDKIWKADPDSFVLTPLGAAEAFMVYQAATSGATTG